MEAHPLHHRSVPGFLTTVGDLARTILDNAVSSLRATRKYRDMDYDDLVEHGRLAAFIDEIGGGKSFGAPIPTVGPWRKCRIWMGRTTMADHPAFHMSCAFRGIRVADDLPADGFSAPYVVHGVRLLLQKTPLGIADPIVELQEDGSRQPRLVATYEAVDEDGRTVECILPAWAHGSLQDLDTAIDQLATQMYLRQRHADDLKRIRAAIAARIRDEAGPLVGIAEMRMTAPRASGLDKGRPRMGKMLYEVDLEALDDELDPEVTTHEVEASSQDEITIPSSVRKLGIRSRQRAMRAGRPTIDRISALRIAENPDDLRPIAEALETGRLGDVCRDAVLGARDGLLHRSVLIAQEPRAMYRNGTLSINGASLPHTIRMALRGRPARQLIDHPHLEGSTIRFVAETEEGIRARLSVPELDAGAVRAMMAENGAPS